MMPFSRRPILRRAAGTLLAMLVLALLLGPEPGRAAEGDCRQKRIADIPSRITPENGLLISAKLNELPVELLLDTGMGISALSRSLVERLGLPIETTHDLRYKEALTSVSNLFDDPASDARDPGYAGSELTERTRIPRLVLGGAVTEYESFGVVPVGGDGSDGRPAGLFGMDYLLLYDLELDPAAGRVRLFEQDHCGDRVVYWSRSYSVLPLSVDPVTRWATTEVELDGRKLRALIDTGREHTILPMGVAEHVFGLTETSPGVKPSGSEVTLEGRTAALYTLSFKTLKLGDLVVDNPRITLETLRRAQQPTINSHISRRTQIGPDIIIGENLLRRMRMYFAFKDSIAYFTLLSPLH